MTSTFTTNKSLEEPANGDYVSDWNVPMNANFSAIDQCFGGVTTLNAVGASGTTTLTLSQYRSPIIEVAGALTANVTYQIPPGVGGFWCVFNITSGSFTVTFVCNTGTGLSYSVPQGSSAIIFSDGTSIVNANTVPVTYAATAGSATTAGTASNAAEVSTANFNIVQLNPNNLYFQFNGVNIAKIDNNGNFTSIGNITAGSSV